MNIWDCGALQSAVYTSDPLGKGEKLTTGWSATRVRMDFKTSGREWMNK